LSGASGATLSAWVYRDVADAAHGILAATISTLFTKVYVEFTAQNRIRAGARSVSTDSFQAVVTTATFGAEQWYHVVVTINLTTNEVLIYVDGVLQQTTGAPSFGQTTFSEEV